MALTRRRRNHAARFFPNLADVRLWVAASAVALLAAATAHSAVGSFPDRLIPLRVNANGQLAEARPLKGGVPFPAGTLPDVAPLRLFDERGGEVPAQFDVAATWPDGSVRWALVAFRGSALGAYSVGLGDGVRPTPEPGIRMARDAAGAVAIDTGVARFLLAPDGLMIESAQIGARGSPRNLWSSGGAGAYLIDNRGREARVAGPLAEVETAVLKEGPARITLRREGWYVSDGDERLARGVARMSFYAGSAAVRLSHSLIFTEDTDEVWIRDYGIEVPFVPTGEATVRFDASRKADATPVYEHALAEDETVSMTQETFPHFLSADSRFAIESSRPGVPGRVLRKGAVAGDWCDVASGGLGLTFVLPDLAEQFPKALEAGRGGIRARLWAGGPERELDFRAPSLVEWYMGEWAENPVGRGASSKQEIAAVSSNAQASARTHEFWLLPRSGNESADSIAQRAESYARPAFVHADPRWTMSTEAIGWPMHPHDPEQFSEEEAAIAEIWERTFLPEQVFPMTGFIAWGAQPPHSFRQVEGRWQAGLMRLSTMIDYGLRERRWTLFARSGERAYAESGWRYNRFAFDWNMHHWNAGRKFKGGFASGHTHLPFYWGTRSILMRTSNSGHTLQNFLFEYWMTGNELAKEAVKNFAEGVLREPAEPFSHPTLAVRVLTHAYTLDWNPEIGRLLREVAHEQFIDLDSPNGVNREVARGRPLYKTHRMGMSLYEYWRATGDPKGREAFLKLVDYEYRFNRIARPLSGQNFSAYLFSLAYRMAGKPAYYRIVHGMMQGGLAMMDFVLDEEAEGDGVDLRGATRSHNPVHMNIHPMLGMPTAMGLIAEKGGEDPGPPAHAVKSGMLRAEAVFRFEPRQDAPAELALFARTPRGRQPQLTVLDMEGNEVADIRVEVEQQLMTDNVNFSPSPRGQYQFHLRVALPQNAPAGLYRLRFDDLTEFAVFESGVGPLALFVPEGCWTGYHNSMTGVLPKHFYVPGGLETLELFVNTPTFRLRRPDGTDAIEPDDERKGRIEVPVGGASGFWSVESTHPVHWRLLNVPPVVSVAPAPLLTPEERAGLLAHAEAFNQEPTPPDAPFAPGPHGTPALHLPQGKSVRVAATPDGAALPPQGTVEFWFRPNWASTSLVHEPYRLGLLPLLESKALQIGLSYGVGFSSRVTYSHPRIRLVGADGASVGTRDRLLYTAHWFRRGEWAHVAATWAIQEQENGDATVQSAVFVNGRQLGETFEANRRGGFALASVEEGLTLGPELDGAVADLRISSVIRYEGDFQVPEGALPTDVHTITLHRFAGENRR